MKNISFHQKHRKLASAFYHEKIKSFWTKFFPKMSINQKNFSSTWKILSRVYKEYKKTLLKNKLAYKGLVYREF